MAAESGSINNIENNPHKHTQLDLTVTTKVPDRRL
jgi:hypothetical protein